MKFPQTIRHRNATVKIYGKTAGNPYYRIGWRSNRKQFFKNYTSYKEAHEAAKEKAKALSQGNLNASLSAREAEDARIALNCLSDFRKETGREVTLAEVVAQWIAASGKIDGHTLTDAVETFASSLSTIKRRDIGDAVDAFMETRKGRTEAKDGKRAALSAEYNTHVGMWLRQFSKTFPETAVADLTKEHIDTYFGQFKKVGPKSRNDRRAALKMFLNWSARQDYLARNHRLFEAEEMKREDAHPEEIEFFTPKELRQILDGAEERLRPLIALGALAGLRSVEIRRLTWEDVFRVPGHVEVSGAKSKTRQRRLVTIVPALEQWLAPYRNHTGPVWTMGQDAHEEAFAKLLVDLEIRSRRNGLRHSFCSFHFALHGNENLTAAEAGNSPTMLHRNYRGLATKAEAGQWFAIAPAQAANVIPIEVAAGS